jgi:hypothetical protein
MDLQIIGLKASASAVSTGKTDSKPTWNNSKVYKYLEDYNDAAVAYGNQMAQYYRTQTNSDGKLTEYRTAEAAAQTSHGRRLSRIVR